MRIAAFALALLAIAAPGCAAGKNDVLAGPTELAAGATLIPIRPPVGGAAGPATLVIEGLAYDAPLGVMYQLSFQSRAGRRAPVGLISFINETGYGAAAPPTGRRSFDAGPALRALGGDVAALVFEPTAGVTGVNAQAAPTAHLRFKSASLER